MLEQDWHWMAERCMVSLCKCNIRKSELWKWGACSDRKNEDVHSCTLLSCARSQVLRPRDLTVNRARSHYGMSTCPKVSFVVISEKTYLSFISEQLHVCQQNPLNSLLLLLLVSASLHIGPRVQQSHHHFGQLLGWHPNCCAVHCTSVAVLFRIGHDILHRFKQLFEKLILESCCAHGDANVCSRRILNRINLPASGAHGVDQVVNVEFITLHRDNHGVRVAQNINMWMLSDCISNCISSGEHFFGILHVALVTNMHESRPARGNKATCT
mmetsp:Transcript_1657/g.5774  ORF Transcript_1657/g.5774 Transcript_1657/m.5774 type:complete len:270 (+) Transcript_1657:1045-1854(+)